MAAKKKTSKSKAVMLPWQQQLAEHAKGGKKLKEKSSQSTVVSLKGSKFKVDNGKARTELTGVILEACLERSYYDQPYTEGESNIPGCYAISYDLDNVLPAENCVNKQADNCAECDLSKWIDDEKPECSERRKLAMLVQTDDEEPVIRTVSIPPSSLRNWKDFYKDITEQGLELLQASIVMYFDDESSAAYPPIVFEMTSEIKKPKQLEELVAHLPEAQKLLEQGYDPSAYKAPSAKGGKKKTKKKAAKKKTAKKKSKFSR